MGGKIDQCPPMSLTLYHGAAGSGKSAILLREISEKHFHSQLLRSFRFVVPNAMAVEETRRQLQKISGAKGLFFLDAVVTFDQLLISLLKKNLPRVHLISPMTTRNLLRRLLSEKSYPSLEQAKKFPGLIRKLAESFVRLKKSGIEPVKLRLLFERHASAGINDFLNLFDDYQALCAHYSFFDAGELTTSTLYLLRKGALAWPEEVTHQAIDRLFPISLGERLFISELSQHHPKIDIRVSLSFDYRDRDDPFFYPAFSFLGEIASSTEAFSVTKEAAPLTLRYATDPASEIRSVVDEIGRRIAEGMEPDQISVLLPAEEFYRERLSRELTARGIPHHPTYRPRLDRCPAPAGTLEGLIPMLADSPSESIEQLLSAAKTKEDFRHEWDFDRSLLFPASIDPETAERWRKEEEGEVRIPARPGSGGVRLGTLRDLYWADSEYLFITGFTSRFYPSVPDEHPFFTPEMLSDAGLREILGGPVFQWEMERRRLQQAVGRARGGVCLSVPKIFWNGEEQFASRLLDSSGLASLSAGEGGAPFSFRSAATVASASTPLTRGAFRTETTSEPSGEFVGFPSLHEKGAPPSPAAMPAHKTCFPRWHQTQFSLTELVTCRKCPYQYYARHHLKIELPEEERTEIPADEAGLFVHDLLMNLYRNHLDLYREAIEYDLYLKRFLDAAAALVADGRRSPEAWKNLPAPIVEGFEERVLATIRQMVTEEVERIRSGVKKTIPRHFEWTFGGKGSPPLKIRGNGGDVMVSGRIDRIDVNEEKKIFSVIDYKTGGLDSVASIKEGDSLQIPVYLMAVSDLLLKGYRPASGVFIGLKEEVKWSGIVFSGAGEEDLLKKSSCINPTEWEALRSGMGQTIAGLIQKIREGNLSPDPVSKQECRVCDFRTLCHYEQKNDFDT